MFATIKYIVYMKTAIAILGTGTVGRTLAGIFSAKGYAVTIGTRDPAETLARTGDNSFGDWFKNQKGIEVKSFGESVASGALIVNALNGNHTLDVLKSCDPSRFSGKTVMDISNPLDFSKGFPPTLLTGLNNTNSLGEAIQQLLPDAKVVKTLNTMWCGLMLNPLLIPGSEHLNFICGNDAAAKADVISLLSDFGWKPAQHIDLGDITAARGTEGYLLLWTRIYGATKNGAFNIAMQKVV